MQRDHFLAIGKPKRAKAYKVGNEVRFFDPDKCGEIYFMEKNLITRNFFDLPPRINFPKDLFVHLSICRPQLVGESLTDRIIKVISTDYRMNGQTAVYTFFSKNYIDLDIYSFNDIHVKITDINKEVIALKGETRLELHFKNKSYQN